MQVNTAITKQAIKVNVTMEMSYSQLRLLVSALGFAILSVDRGEISFVSKYPGNTRQDLVNLKQELSNSVGSGYNDRIKDWSVKN